MRCAAIEKLLGGVRKLIRELYQGKEGCSEACSGMLLGFLQRGLWKEDMQGVVSLRDREDRNSLRWYVGFAQLLST